MMDSWWGCGNGNCGMYAGWGFPFWGWGMMLIWIIVFLAIGYFVYLDANKRA